MQTFNEEPQGFYSEAPIGAPKKHHNLYSSVSSPSKGYSSASTAATTTQPHREKLAPLHV
jgi:hypothetical protein